MDVTLINPPQKALFQLPGDVLPLIAQSRLESIPFEERYRFANDYQEGYRRLQLHTQMRSLVEDSGCCEVMVDGVFMLAIYNPKNYNVSGVQYVLNRLYRGEVQATHHTYFNDPCRRNKASEANAWFDLSHGLFWTWQRLQINRVRNNFRRSVRATGNENPDQAYMKAAHDFNRLMPSGPIPVDPFTGGQSGSQIVLPIPTL